MVGVGKRNSYINLDDPYIFTPSKSPVCYLLVARSPRGALVDFRNDATEEE